MRHRSSTSSTASATSSHPGASHDTSSIAVTVIIEEDGYAPISVDGAVLNLFVERLEVCVPETKFTVKIYLRDVYRLSAFDGSDGTAASRAPELVLFTGCFAPRRYILRAYGPGSTTSLRMLYDMIKGKIHPRDAPDFPAARTDAHQRAAERIFGRSPQPVVSSQPVNLEDLGIGGGSAWPMSGVRTPSMTSRSASHAAGGVDHGSSQQHRDATNIADIWNTSSRRLPPDVGSNYHRVPSSQKNHRRQLGDAADRADGTEGPQPMEKASHGLDAGVSPLAPPSSSTHVSFLSPSTPPAASVKHAAVQSDGPFMDIVATTSSAARVPTATATQAVQCSERAIATQSAQESTAVQTMPTSIPLSTPQRSATRGPPAGPVAAPSAPLWLLRRNVLQMQRTDELLHRTPAEGRRKEYDNLIALVDHLASPSSSRNGSSRDMDVRLPADAYYAHEATLKAREFRFPSNIPHPKVAGETTGRHFDVPFASPIGQSDSIEHSQISTPVHPPSPSTPSEVDAVSRVEQREQRLMARMSLVALQKKTSTIQREDVLRSLEGEAAGAVSPTGPREPQEVKAVDVPHVSKQLALPGDRAPPSASTRAVTFGSSSGGNGAPSASTLQRSATASVPQGAPLSTPQSASTLQRSATASVPQGAPLSRPQSAGSLQAAPGPAVEAAPAVGQQPSASTLVVHENKPSLAAGASNHNTVQPPPPTPPSELPVSAPGSAAPLPAHKVSHAGHVAPQGSGPPPPKLPDQPSLFTTYTGIPYAQSIVVGASDTGDADAAAQQQQIPTRDVSVSSVTTGNSPPLVPSSVDGDAWGSASSRPRSGVEPPAAASRPPPRLSSVRQLEQPPSVHAAPMVRPLSQRIQSMGGVPMPHMQHAATTVAPPPPVQPTVKSTGPQRPSLDGAPTLLRRVATAAR